jgi:hypothetical protein
MTVRPAGLPGIAVRNVSKPASPGASMRASTIVGVAAGWARRETDVARREQDVGSRERALALRLELARVLLAAAGDRDAAADALDALADQRERDLDLVHLLMPVDSESYGADWPARRLAALDRARAKADRSSAREDLIAVLAHDDHALEDL